MSNSTPTGIDDLYPPRWVTAADLSGKAVTVKVARVDVETFFVPQINQEKTAIVLAFEGKTWRLILNKTQAKAMVQLTGSKHFAEWVGYIITLTSDRAPNGKPTIAIGKAQASSANLRLAYIHTPGSARSGLAPAHEKGGATAISCIGSRFIGSLGARCRKEWGRD